MNRGKKQVGEREHVIAIQYITCINLWKGKPVYCLSITSLPRHCITLSKKRENGSRQGWVSDSESDGHLQRPVKIHLHENGAQWSRCFLRVCHAKQGIIRHIHPVPGRVF